jgi:deoxyribodipyrimidine photolyase-related protein
MKTNQKAGFKVEYIESSSKFSDIRNLIPKLEKENFKTIKTTDVCDNWLEKGLKETKLELEIWTVHFSSTPKKN